jgi:hypothetical protein
MAAAERFANALLHTGDVALYGRMFDLDVPDRWAAPTIFAGVERYRPGVQIRVALRVGYLFPYAEVPLLMSRLCAWATTQHEDSATADRRPGDSGAAPADGTVTCSPSTP